MFENIIVIGVTHHNTLGTIRSIGESDSGIFCTLILYGEKDSFLSQSIYVNKIHYIDSSDEITSLLLSMKKETKQIIVTVTDEAAYQLDKNMELLVPYFYYYKCVNSGQLTHYMNKYVQDEIAVEAGLYVPLNYNPNNIQFPCILKPIKSIGGGKKLIICNNNKDYIDIVNQYNNIEFQIQQYIEKEQEIVLSGVSINGEVYIPAYILKHREVLGGTTYSSVYPISSLNDDLVTKSKELVKSIGYEGLFGIEYMLCNGKYYFVEINLRNDATCYSVAKAGVNTQLAYIYAKLGKEYLPLLTNYIHKINSMVEFRDFNFVLNKQVGLIKWINQRNNCECLYFCNKNDRKPYLINRKLLMNSIKKTIINKLSKCIKKK